MSLSSLLLIKNKWFAICFLQALATNVDPVPNTSNMWEIAVKHYLVGYIFNSEDEALEIYLEEQYIGPYTSMPSSNLFFCIKKQ